MHDKLHTEKYSEDSETGGRNEEGTRKVCGAVAGNLT